MHLQIQQQDNIFLLFVFRMERAQELLPGTPFSNLPRTQPQRLQQLQARAIYLPLDITIHIGLKLEGTLT